MWIPTGRRYTSRSPRPRTQTGLSSRPQSPPWRGNHRQSLRWQSLAPKRHRKRIETGKVDPRDLEKHRLDNRNPRISFLYSFFFCILSAWLTSLFHSWGHQLHHTVGSSGSWIFNDFVLFVAQPRFLCCISWPLMKLEFPHEPFSLSGEEMLQHSVLRLCSSFGGLLHMLETVAGLSWDYSKPLGHLKENHTGRNAMLSSERRSCCFSLLRVEIMHVLLQQLSRVIFLADPEGFTCF